MLNEEHILSKYLDGELSSEEKEQLENKLAADQDLQLELDRLRVTREAVKLYGLQKKVSSIHKEMMKELRPEKKVRKLSRAVRYTVAAAASLLLLVGAYLIYNFITLSSEKVYSANYQTYEGITLRDGNSNESEISAAYRNKQYKQVLRLKKSDDSPDVQEEFLAGAAALELKEYTKAIEFFRQVLLENKKLAKPVLNDEAEYYLALSYIKNKDYDYALGLLKEIDSNPNHLYHQKVTPKLVRQVKMLKWR